MSPDEDQVWKRKEDRKWRLQPCGSRTGPQAGHGALLGVGSPWETGEEGGQRGQPETQRLLGSQAPLVRRERGLGERDDENGTPGVRLYFIALKEKGKIGPGFEKKIKKEKKERKRAECTPTQSRSETGLNEGLRLRMSSQRHRAPRQLSPRAPAGTRAACGEEKRPLLGSAQGSEPAASHIKTPREPPQLPAGGRGQLGHWGPDSFPHRAPYMATAEENPAGN